MNRLLFLGLFLASSTPLYAQGALKSQPTAGGTSSRAGRIIGS